MKRSSRPAVLGALVLLLWAAAVFAAGPGGPRLVVTETRFDFGTVTEGQTAEHVFELRNTGDAVLEIVKVQPT
jgi:hypothetical protein